MIKNILITVSILLYSQLYAKDLTQVATVNGEVITKSELDRATDILAPQTYFHANLTGEKRKKVQKKALEKLIEKKLLLQFSKKEGLSATKNEVDAQEAKLRSSFKDKEGFIAALKKANFSYEEFRKELEVDIIMQKFYNRYIKTTYSDEALKEYYESNRYKFKEPEKIKIRVIYVKNDPTDPKGKIEAKSKIQEAYNRLKAGENFADIAAKYSDAMSRINGGEIGYTHKGRFDKEVEDVAFSLDIGQMSDIIMNDKGYYIVLLEGKKPVKVVKFEAVKDRLRKELIAKSENQKKNKILKQLQNDAQIWKQIN